VLTSEAAVPGFVSLVDEVVDVSERRDRQFAQVLDVRSVQRMFSDAQVTRVLRVEQIAHVFAVDLHVAHLNISTSAAVQAFRLH